MPYVKIEMDRGNGWETRAEGFYSIDCHDLINLLSRYAIQYSHRAFLDGVMVGEMPPKKRA